MSTQIEVEPQHITTVSTEHLASTLVDHLRIFGEGQSLGFKYRYHKEGIYFVFYEHGRVRLNGEFYNEAVIMARSFIAGYVSGQGGK